jgi:hypothetical protein
MPEGCVLTGFCLITNILLQGSLDVCPGQIVRRGGGSPDPDGINIMHEHSNFTWIDQTNTPADPVTIEVTVESDCAVNWTAWAEGVQSSPKYVVSSGGQPGTLVHTGVNFGGDWLNYRVWVDLPGEPCFPRITNVEIF